MHIACLITLVATLAQAQATPTAGRNKPAAPPAPAEALAVAGHARSRRLLPRRHRRPDGRQHEKGARGLSEARQPGGRAGRRPADQISRHRRRRRRSIRADPGGHGREGKALAPRVQLAARGAGRALPCIAGVPAAVEPRNHVRGGRRNPGAECRADGDPRAESAEANRKDDPTKARATRRRTLRRATRRRKPRRTRPQSPRRRRHRNRPHRPSPTSS